MDCHTIRRRQSDAVRVRVVEQQGLLALVVGVPVLVDVDAGVEDVVAPTVEHIHGAVVVAQDGGRHGKAVRQYGAVQEFTETVLRPGPLHRVRRRQTEASVSVPVDAEEELVEARVGHQPLEDLLARSLGPRQEAGAEYGKQRQTLHGCLSQSLDSCGSRYVNEACTPVLARARQRGVLEPRNGFPAGDPSAELERATDSALVRKNLIKQAPRQFDEVLQTAESAASCAPWCTVLETPTQMRTSADPHTRHLASPPRRPSEGPHGLPLPRRSSGR